MTKVFRSISHISRLLLERLPRAGGQFMVLTPGGAPSFKGLPLGQVAEEVWRYLNKIRSVNENGGKIRQRIFRVSYFSPLSVNSGRGAYPDETLMPPIFM